MKVTFDSDGTTLTGNLFLLDAERAPGVVVAGTWTSVKELMADRYAERLAERGYAALSFDFTGFGESGGEPRDVEYPARKIRDIVVKTRWLTKTGNRYLQETTKGTLNGSPYYRIGVLGFSNIDRRYEWTTFDNVTPQAMTYRGTAVQARPAVLSIPGEFTDPGLLGAPGRTIPMRTVITISPDGWHTFDLYFTPPGQAERLVDKVVYSGRLD